MDDFNYAVFAEIKYGQGNFEQLSNWMSLDDCKKFKERKTVWDEDCYYEPIIFKRLIVDGG